MADSRRKAPSSQPWKYVSRIQAAQENREALEVMARAAKERLATGDVRGSREALAQASPNTVTRSKAKGFNIMEEVGNRLRQARPEAAFAHDKKLVTNALADKARRIVSGDSKLVPAPTVEPPRIKKKDFSITRLAGDVSHYAAALNPVGNIVEGVDIARGKGDARERWLATISGEKFQDRLGIGTRYMDRLREQGLLGEVASGVIDTATAPATYIPGVGPIGGGASLTSKVGAKILARRAAAELVGGGLGQAGAAFGSEETAKHTDNPWIVGGAGIAGGLIGGVGGYTGVEKAGDIARTGVKGAKAADRLATAGDRALLRKFPKLASAEGSAEAGEFRMGGAGEPKPAATFEDAAFERYPSNPMNPRELIVGDTVVELGGRGWIKSIRSMKPGEGEASKALKEITDLADETETTLTLDVVPTGKGGLSKKALKSWYERNGFEMEARIGNTKAEDYWVGTREPQAPEALARAASIQKKLDEAKERMIATGADGDAVNDAIALAEKKARIAMKEAGIHDFADMSPEDVEPFFRAAGRQIQPVQSADDAAQLAADAVNEPTPTLSVIEQLAPTRTDAVERLGRMVKRAVGLGQPKNDRIVLQDARGKLVIGRLTKQDWLERVQTFITRPEDMKEGRFWYENLHQGFMALDPEDREIFALAWLMSQQQISPSGGMQNVLRAEEVGRFGLPEIKQAGLSKEALYSIFRGIAPDRGANAKLLDFLDSALLKSTRRVMGDAEEGGAPAVIDVWSGRDTGLVDGPMLNYVRKRFGAKAADALQRDFEGGVGETAYEASAKFYRDTADWLNEMGFDGGNWTPYQVQAVGWWAMQKAMDSIPESASDIFTKNTRRISTELGVHADSPLGQKWDFNALDDGAQARVTNSILDKMIAKVEELVPNSRIRRVTRSIGGDANGTQPTWVVDAFVSTETAEDIADILGFLGQQDMTMSRRLASGNTSGLDLTLPKGVSANNEGLMATVWAKLRQAEPDLFNGYKPYEYVDSAGDTREGIRLLDTEKKWGGSKTGKGEEIRERMQVAIHDALADIEGEAEVVWDNFDVQSRGNNWLEKPNGDDHIQRLTERGRSTQAGALADQSLDAERNGWWDEAFRAEGQEPRLPGPGTPSGEAGSVSAALAAQLATTVGGAAYGYATGDDQQDRWKRALVGGVAGAVGTTALRVGLNRFGKTRQSWAAPTLPTPAASILKSLPEESIESTVVHNGRERINPKVGHAGADAAVAAKQEALHAPGRISLALPPVLRKGVALLNPSNLMDQTVLVAWRARQATKAKLMVEFNTAMTPFVEAVESLHHQAIYTGPEPNARTAHIIGTWKDIFDRPEVYEMTPALREAIDDLDAASWDFVSGRAKAEYGVDVNPYTAQGKPDFAYLPTVARKSDMDSRLDSALDGLSTSRRAKRRGYQTAYDRMMADPDFEPETGLRELVTTLNEAMASNAGDAVLKRGAGGKALAEVIDELHPGLRKDKLRARANMVALGARAKEAMLSKNRILRETSLSDTELAAVEKRMAPITDRVDELTADGEFGIELSYLSGQQRELEILRAKVMKNIETKEGRAAWQDVRLDKALADIDSARTQVEDLMRAYESAGTGNYVQDPSTHRWHTPEAAQTMNKLLSQPAGMGKHLAELADEIRATHLAGDLSPLTIQGVLGVILDPVTAYKALRRVTGDPLRTLQHIAATELDDVADYSFATGRRFGLQLPEYSTRSTVGTEGRRGIGRIPGVGPVEDKVFAIIQVMQYEQWKNDRALVQGWNPGMSKELAGHEAASALSKLIPGLDPSERGVSSSRAAVERAAITSVSFAAAPAMLAADIGTGFAKFLPDYIARLARAETADPRLAWKTLSGREQLAIRRSFQATATVMGLAAATAAASAESRDMDPWDAVKETWDPNSRYFMAVQFGEGRSIPIGGPFRSAIKGIAPDRNGVPFGNLPGFLGAKMNSPLRLPLDVKSNKDFFGDAIYEGNVAKPENLLRVLWYGSEAVMPVALGEASEAIRKQDKPMDETAQSVIAQFAGTNYTPVSPNEKLDQLARAQYEGKDFYSLLPKQQDAIKKANPSVWNQAVAKGSDARQQAEALKAEKRQEQESDDQLLLDGKLSLDDWEKGRSDRQNQLVGAERAIYSDSNFTGKKTNPTLQKYYDAIDDATTNGRVDWDEVQAFRDQLSDRENKLIDENTGLRKTKLEKLRSDVSSEYYDLPRYRGYTADEARAIDELWQEVRNNSRSADDANMLSALRKMDTEGVDDEILKAVKKRIVGTLTEDTARSRWARAHPEVAIIQRQGKLTPADVAAIEAAMR